MKRFIFFARVYILCIVACPVSVIAQDPEPAFPNYVVIGAFAYQKNAVRFTEEARRSKFTARFEMNPNRNLYYVYALATDDRDVAIAEALKLRSETKYFDTWVYSGYLGKADAGTVAGGGGKDINPLTGQAIGPVKAEQSQVETASLANTAVPDDDSERRSAQGTTGVVTSRNVDAQSSANKTEGQNKIARTSAEQSQRSDDAIEGDDAQSQTLADGQKSLSPSNRRTSKAETSARDKPRQQPAAQDGLTKELADNTLSDEAARPTEGYARATPRAGQATSGQLVSATTSAGPTTQKKSAASNRAPQRTTDAGEIAPSPGAEETGSNEEEATAADLPGSEKVGLQRMGRTDAGQTMVAIPPPVRRSTAPLTSEDVVGKNFYFYLYRADNAETVPGEVDAIDFEKSRKMGTYPANDGVKVMMAGGKMKHISFVCQVFGYRKLQREFDPASPADDFYLDDKGNLVIPFELVRLQKGDIAIMYNVFFFKDAAVMRPESRYEVNNLLDLLVENPTYNIVIHGHTNGNATGKIIRMNTPGNFYSLSGTTQGFGSAKQLSEERAMVIREFLVSSGISPERMQVKAWGGKKPIHDKHSVRAQENVRVEIEILSK